MDGYFMKLMRKFFGEEADQRIKKGKNHLQSGHIISIIYDAEYNHIKGRVKASQRNAIYDVSVFFDDGGIQDTTSCNCFRAQKHCGHIAAVLYYAHENISCTDRSCRWIKPTRDANEGTMTMTELHPQSKVYTPIKLPSIPCEVWDKLLNKVDTLDGGGAGICYLLEPEPEAEEGRIMFVDAMKVILSEEYDRALSKLDFLTSKLAVTQEQVTQIEEATRGQVKNALWFDVRRGRLTASKFGEILNAMKRGGPSPSLLNDLLNSSGKMSFHATKWGQEHESIAIKDYCANSGLEVQPSGVWLHECGFLAGSPDGLVNKGDIIEVKCPYSLRDKVLSEALNVEDIASLYTDKTHVLKKSVYIIMHHKGDWLLNPNHYYYDQIQGNLNFTRRQRCILIVWTTKSMATIKIDRDDEWSKEKIPLLQQFYITHFITHARRCNS